MNSSPSADDLLAQVMNRNDSQASPAVAVDEPTELGIESLANCLQEAATSVFSKMCGTEIVYRARVAGKPTSRNEMSGIIGLSGPLKATVVVNLSSALAFAVAEAFLGDKPTEMCSDVVDSVGELTNMIAGKAKERLSAPGLSLGLPTVITGELHSVDLSAGMEHFVLTFDSPVGAMQLEIGCKPPR